ncbi:hypothetical protein FOMPIDRAFT_1025193 [Fomitopsis schrenkii]|uniref:Uncharacterized protein n=1 Tax=Fomitopsis schrenkii TaxID=2126942 RepID=S8DWK8_FOMSC|nr:hypothetical protein FOMPIDRAFT_1025193 [Fomitopsis schrenkii]
MEEGPSIPRIIVCPMRPGENAQTSPLPPSPVPTEIEEERIHVCQVEATAAAKAAGVKVRDFAYEAPSSTPGAPEVWRAPLHMLVMHDRYLRAGPSWRRMLKLPGKMLWRLLHSGLVTQEEVQRNWTAEDRDACATYASRPGGPYPTYPAVPKDDVPEHQIYMPPDTDDMDDGTSGEDGAVPTEATSLAAPSSSQSAKAPSAEDKGSPQTKKRRVECESTAGTPSSPSAGGSTSQGEPSLTSAPSHEGAGPSTASTPPRPGQAPVPDGPTPPRPLRRSGLVRKETIIWG